MAVRTIEASSGAQLPVYETVTPLAAQRELTLPQPLRRVEQVISPRVERFSDQSIFEAEYAKLDDELFKDRIEVKGLTIDNPGTKDRDDAIHVERDGKGYVAYVSIADVASLVPIGSNMDKDARGRAFSRYYGAVGSDPMLPKVMTQDKLSLDEAEKRPTLTLVIPVSAHLKIGEPTLTQSFITSRRALSYQEADRIMIENNDPNTEDLRLAFELGLKLAGVRHSEYDPRKGWVISEEGDTKIIPPEESYQSALAVRELMIRANMEAPRFAAKNGIPILSRTHLVEGERGFYSRVYQGHAGLRLSDQEPYSHFTSPIRRYADLASHRQLTAGLKGEELPYDENALDEIADEINIKGALERNKPERTKTVFFAHLVDMNIEEALEHELSLDRFPKTRVLKVLIRQGRLGEFKDWVLEGLKNETIKGGDVYPILFSETTDPMHLELIETLISQFPVQTRASFEAFCRRNEIDDPSYRILNHGKGESKYRSKATIRVKGKTLSTPSIPGITQNTAKNRSYFHLIRILRSSPTFKELKN